MEQNWEKLLKGIIALKSETGLDNWDRYYDNERMYEVSELEQGDIGPAINFLKKRELIRFEPEDNGTRNIFVEDEGFEIAREQKYRESQKKSNKILALFTIILGTSATLNLGVQVVESFASGNIVLIQVIIILGTLLAVLWLVRRMEFFRDI